MNTQTKERTESIAQPAEDKGDVAKPADRKPISVFKDQLNVMSEQIAPVLPPEIDPARFIRIVLTAVQKNPDLLEADRNSLFQSAIEAAADGLLPDNREGAFVIFNTKVKWNGVEQWIKKVQWMPMITGITKKVLATGQVKEFRARVVYEKDQFEVILGDDDQIIHKPHLSKDRGPVVAAYAVLKKHDGGVEREVMIKDDLDEVRSASKTSDFGPWKGWYSEMARKTVSRRLLKRCVFDEDVQSVIERGDEQYELNDANMPRPALPKKNAAKALDDFAGNTAEDAQIIEGSPASAETNDQEVPNPRDKYLKKALKEVDAFKDREPLNQWWLDQTDEREKLGLVDESSHLATLQGAVANRIEELSAEQDDQTFPPDRL